MTENPQLTEIERIFGISQKIVYGKNNELYLPIEGSRLQDIIKRLSEDSFELLSLFCAKTSTVRASPCFMLLKRQVFKKFQYCK